MGMFLTKL